MHEDHMAGAGLQDVDDIANGGAHAEIAPGKSGAHASQHGNQRWAGVGAHDRELVADPQPRGPEPAGDAIAQCLGLDVGEVAAVATQGQTMRMIAAPRKKRSVTCIAQSPVPVIPRLTSSTRETR